MHAYRVEATLEQDGTLTLHNLPLRAGEAVEAIILVRPRTSPPQDHYPLRGTPLTFVDPTGPVAETDWEAAR